MKDKISIEVPKRLALRYQELIRSDWESSTVDHAIQLLRSLIQANGWVLVFDWEPQKPSAKSNQTPYPISPKANDHLRRFLDQLNSGLAPKVPEQIPDRRDDDKVKLARKVAVISRLLTLQAIFDIEGDDGFLLDCQSLLLLSTLTYLNPALKSSGQLSELDYLLNAMLANILNYWAHNPAHRSFLLGLFFEETGRTDISQRSFLESLQSTKPDDHEYMTKAQIYWDSLIDKGQIDDAIRFLLGLNRSADPKDLDEIQDLLDASFELKYAPPKNPRMGHKWKNLKRS